MDGNPKPVSLVTPRGSMPDEPMPTDPNPPVGRAWMAGCNVHNNVPDSAPEREVRINGRRVRAVLDTGSSVSWVQPHILGPDRPGRALLPITCVHGDTKYVPACTVSVSAAPGTWLIEVGVIKDLAVPLLLGRDWKGLDQLLRRPEPVHRKGPPCPRKSCGHPAYLPSESERAGESTNNHLEIFSDLFQQVSTGGSLAREQREDDRLRH